MSEIELCIVSQTGIKNQATEAVLRLTTGGSDKTKLNEDIPVLEITTNTLSNNETEQEQEARENYKKPTEPDFKSYRPKLHALANQANEPKTKIPDVLELIEAQPAGLDGRQAVIFFENPNSGIAYDTGCRLACVSSIDDALLQLVLTVIFRETLRLYQYSLFGRLPEKSHL